ncbi:MAG: hypothetical protein AAF797_15550, partial [Planctomycetota bacterium]
GRAATLFFLLTTLCITTTASISGAGPTTAPTTTTPPAIPLLGYGSPPTPAAGHFFSIPITLDPQNQPLAAYQLELTAAHGTFQVVGIENAPNLPAFPNPARYDRTTAHPDQSLDRLILADFSLAPPEDLPTEPAVIATIHAYAVPPQPLTHPTPEQLTQALGLTATLTQAANPQGQPIPATVTLSKPTP